MIIEYFIPPSKTFHDILLIVCISKNIIIKENSKAASKKIFFKYTSKLN